MVLANLQRGKNYVGVDRSDDNNQLTNYPTLHGSSFQKGEHKFNRWH